MAAETPSVLEQALAILLGWLPEGYRGPAATLVLLAAGGAALIAKLATVKENLGKLLSWGKKDKKGDAAAPAVWEAELIRGVREGDITVDDARRLAQAVAGKQFGSEAKGEQVSQQEARAYEDALVEAGTSDDPKEREAAALEAEGDPGAAYDALAELAEQDAEHAADRWRTAGALAAPHSIRQAVQAYENARRIDPDHCWTHIELARLYRRAGRTADAHESVERAIACSPGEWEKMVALDELGDGLVQLEEPDEAFKCYSQALRIARRLAAENPDADGARRDVSVSLERMGEAHVRKGEHAAAEVCLEESLTIRRTLAERDEDSPTARRDILVSLVKVGDVLLAQDRGEDALERYREALAIGRELADAQPGGPAERDKAAGFEKVGDALHALGRGGEARENYEQSLAITETLMARDSGSARAKRDVAEGHIKIARLGGEDAARHWEQACELTQGLRGLGRLAPADAWMLDEACAAARPEAS